MESDGLTNKYTVVSHVYFLRTAVLHGDLILKPYNSDNSRALLHRMVETADASALDTPWSQASRGVPDGADGGRPSTHVGNATR